ncbi:MAG TPA: hypothetical protein DCZ75_02875 [Geobacter sp.]|nr:hypothetical protein [Geobacter sp.]
MVTINDSRIELRDQVQQQIFMFFKNGRNLGSRFEETFQWTIRRHTMKHQPPRFNILVTPRRAAMRYKGLYEHQ